MLYDLELLLNLSDPQFPHLRNKNTNISFAEFPPAKEHQECTLCPTELDSQLSSCPAAEPAAMVENVHP